MSIFYPTPAGVSTRISADVIAIRPTPYQWRNPRTLPPRTDEERARYCLDDWSEADDLAWRTWTHSLFWHPDGRRKIGCEPEGFHYDWRFKKGTLWVTRGDCPDPWGTVEFFWRWCSDVRRIVIDRAMDDSTFRPYANLVRVPPGDEHGEDFGACGWWRELAPGQAEYVY